MATPEQIELTLEALQATHPKELFHAMDMQQAGIGAVLRLVYESEETVTAGKIADFMGVSTARVAVLLKKMVAQGLIIRESDARDARVTVVRLSEQGSRRVEAIRTHVYTHIGAVIDKIGMDRMQEFIAISREIQAAAVKPDFDMEVHK